jgi:hypothetical protein
MFALHFSTGTHWMSESALVDRSGLKIELILFLSCLSGKI